MFIALAGLQFGYNYTFYDRSSIRSISITLFNSSIFFSPRRYPNSLILRYKAVFRIYPKMTPVLSGVSSYSDISRFSPSRARNGAISWLNSSVPMNSPFSSLTA